MCKCVNENGSLGTMIILHSRKLDHNEEVSSLCLQKSSSFHASKASSWMNSLKNFFLGQKTVNQSLSEGLEVSAKSTWELLGILTLFFPQI